MSRFRIIISLFVITLLVSCASTRMIPIDRAEPGKTARVYMKSGEKFDALIFENQPENLVIISKEMHKKINVPKKLVKRIDYLDEYLDYNADPISNAEVNKYKGKKHSVTYTMGGFVLGGLTGVAVGLPLWYADTGVKPLFTGGVGAILGGVYFGFKGKKQDEKRAVETIRIVRQKKTEIRKQTGEKEMELEKLKEIEQQKKELQKKLKKRK